MIRHALAAIPVILAGSSAVSTLGAETVHDWWDRLVEPSGEFSQMPFWFWNDELDDGEIRRQMADFREHGVFGFVIHARMGLPRSIPYMGERWLGHVRTAVEEAKRTGMRVCLYDEGMYPSGSAHGEVVRSNPAFGAQGLLVSFDDVTGPVELPFPRPAEGRHVSTVVARRAGEGEQVTLSGLRDVDPGTRMISLPEGDWRVMTFACVPSGGHIRGVHEGEDDRQPDAPPAADLLNPEAMQAFIRFAYDPYHRTLKAHFGATIIGMFTDEPSMLGRGARRGLMPWTDGLAAYFESRRGYALLPLLPALFYNIGDETERVRRDFRLTLAERLDETYYRPLSEWCEARGIALTGHPAGATEIGPLRYFQIPGQDLVWRGVVPGNDTALEGPNSAIAKCSSSVARHDRRRLNSNEVYGAYGWQLTMEEMKWVADWLLVRGVNTLYPHAFYYSIRDDRVHERPPDVGPHNAWWPYYRQFADYTARLCGLLTDSRQVCEVAILGANRQLPWRAAKWLYQHQVDFNYLEQWRLCEQAVFEGGRMKVGEMAYTTLIIDQDEALDGRVAEKVEAFQAAGGTVRYCRGEPTAAIIEDMNRDILVEPGASDLRYAHVVKDGVDFYLLVNEGESAIDGRLTVRSRGRSDWFDAWSGEFRPAPVLSAGEQQMVLPLRLDRRESVVLCIAPGDPVTIASEAGSSTPVSSSKTVSGPWRIVDSQGRRMAEGLGDWHEQAATADVVGTLRYETSFTFTRRAECRYVLNLGGVGDFAVVYLNGDDLGVRFWAPYAWDVTGSLRDGANQLAVEVTGSLANRYDEKQRRPSGLFGPVDIVELQNQP